VFEADINEHHILKYIFLQTEEKYVEYIATPLRINYFRYLSKK